MIWSLSDLRLFRRGMEHAAAAYADAPTVRGLELVHSIRHAATDTQGYVGVDHDPHGTGTGAPWLVVALRGTSSLRDWVTDGSFAWSSPDFLAQGPGRVHAGFAECCRAIAPQVRAAAHQVAKKYGAIQAMVPGHSLGGGLCSGAGPVLAGEGFVCPILVTGDAPRFGDADYAAFLDQVCPHHFRLVMGEEIVHRLPPHALGWRHAGTGILEHPDGRTDDAPDELFPDLRDFLADLTGESVREHAVGLLLSALDAAIARATPAA